MKKLSAFAVSLALAAAMMSSAGATVLVDGTPTGAYVNNYYNEAYDQNILIQLTLGSKTSIDSIDIFTSNNLGMLGDSTTVRFRSDVNGAPAASNLYEFVAPVSGVTPYDEFSHVSSVTLTPFTLDAGTYWFGVSRTASDTGIEVDLGWSAYSTFTQKQFLLSGEDIVGRTGIEDLAFRINGEVLPASDVPEPASLALFGVATGGLLLARRKRSI